MRLFLLSLVFLMFSSTAFSQASIQKNVGFEYNSFLNWRCYRDTTYGLPSSVTYNTNPLSGVNTTAQNLFTNKYYKSNGGRRYWTETTTGAGTDKYGKYPIVCNLPGAGKHSCKIGSDSIPSYAADQSSAHGVSYNLKIPANSNKFKVVYYYAINLEDPDTTTHQEWEAPFFSVNAFDSANPSNVISCSQFSINVHEVLRNPDILGSWHTSSSLSPNGLKVYYTAWTPATLIAKNMPGKTLTIQFISSGCSPAFAVYDSTLPATDSSVGGFGSHFGYAYVDFDSTSGPINDDTIRYCKHTNCITYNAPYGYHGYTIIDSASGTLLAYDTSKAGVPPVFTLCGANLPAPKTTMEVILTPNVGFGCIDTIKYFIDTFPTNILPPIIAPRDSICASNSMNLTDAAPNGTWASNSTGIATVGLNSGIFTGIFNGWDSIVYYAKNKFGCDDTTYKSLFVVGHSLPAITGKNGVCIPDTLHLSDSLTGGTWSVDNSSLATIDQNGVLTAIKFGKVTVSYAHINYFGCLDSVTKQIQVGIPPLQSIIGNTVFCIHHNDTLTNSTIGGVWSSSNTAVATINSSTGILAGIDSGNTNIKYVVSFNGCSDSISLPIKVNAPIITQITGNNVVCQNHTVQLSNTSTGGTWISLNTSVANVSSTGIITTGIAGSDSIKYILPISNGCIDSVYKVVTVNPAPKIGAINGPSSDCFGVPATFTDTTAGGKWTSSDTSIIKINAAGIVQYFKPGTVTIKYIVTNAFGCIDSVFTNFTVNPIPIVNPIVGQNAICTGNSTILTTTSIGGVWSSSDNTVATVSGGSINGVKGGSVVIKYTIVSAGCSDSATYNVSVVDFPVVKPIVGDSVICIGHSTIFTDATANGVWTVLDSSVATIDANGNATPVKVGNTTIQYKVTLPPGCSDSIKYNIRVASFFMNLVSSPTNPILQNSPVTVTVNSTSSNYSVLAWTPTSMFSNQTFTSQTFNVVNTDTICAIGKSNDGCIDTACTTILVTPLNTTIFIPNVININANSHNNAIVRVWATPANPGLKALDFRIFDQWGEMIFHTNDVNGFWDGKVNGTLEPVGVYVYVARCTTQDDKVINKKGSITLVK